MKGAGKEGLTISGRELALDCIADYARFLASSSHIWATWLTTLALLLIPLTAEKHDAEIPIFVKPNQLDMTFLRYFYSGGMQYTIVIAVSKVAHSNIQL